MNTRLTFLYFFFCFSLAMLSISATDYQLRKIPEINATEITLPNGIKVCLKPIENTDDVRFKAVAPGGYSVLPQAFQPSGKLSAAIAWESGFGPWTGADIANKLLRESIDLETQVGPFSRSMEGSTMPSRVEELLKIVQQLYVQPHFDAAVISKVIERMAASVQLRHQDSETQFEDVIRSVNTKEQEILQPVTEEDLKKIDFAAAKTFYLENFLSTDGLTFLLVGEFSVDKTIPLVVKYLGTIPRRHLAKTLDTTPMVSLPTGITQREVASSVPQECQVRITFPLTADFNEQQWHQLEILSQVIETRLRRRFREVLGSTQGIDVAYELPYYPHRNPAWLAIQFRCAGCQTDNINRLILADLAQLREKGPQKEEVEKVRTLHTRNDEFWIQHKRYWVDMLANYYLWGWDPANSLKDYEGCLNYQPALVQEFAQKHLNTGCYTLVLLKPKR